MANTYLNRAFSSGSTNTKATWSFWVKRSKLSQNQFLFHTRDAENNNYRTYFKFSSNDTFDFLAWNINGTQVINVATSRVFRDTNAWYHIVVRMDTTQGNTSHRIRIYVNGEEETSFGTATYPANGQQVRVVSSVFTRWGFNYTGDSYFNGLLSHINFIEGEDRTPDFFGQTDTTTGEWNIKTSPTGFTYGSNGYFILKDGNSVTDQSVNSNNFTVGGGTLTKTEDNPSNVFATLNPSYDSPDVTFSNGSTTVAEGSNNWRSGYSQIGHSTGKFYAEAKIVYQAGLEGYIGVAQEDHMNGIATYGSNATNGGGPNSGGYDYIGYSNKSVGVYSNGNEDYPSTNTRTGSFRTSGDIMGIAVDIPGNKFYLSKNGVWTNASNNGYGSTTFDASVGAISWTSKWTSGQVFVGCSPNESTWHWNFGNGYFGTTAVSSAGTNASNNGIFEYNVPTGYTAWSTKGLNL